MIVQFQFSKPVDQATQDVRDAISAERAQLPQEIIEPIVQRFDPNQLPIVSLALTSQTLDPAQLTVIADQTLGGDLRAVPGVAQVNIAGADSATMNVVLDPSRLAAAGVGVDQVVAALRAQNLSAPVGSVTSALTERSIRLEGRLARAQDFAQLTVAQRGGTAIALGSVAAVQTGTAERRSAAMFNGREAIGLDVVKSKGYSTTEVADGVKARLPRLKALLPAGTSIEVVRDAGERVRRSVEDVQTTLVEGAALTVLVVFLFLNSWRSTVITGLALPVSALAAFVPLWVFGFTLNTMSLLGLSLAIGILIDDAIVVRENIVRHVEMGKDHHTAAREGTDEIGLAVAATTFSIVAVFLPVGFMSGFAGQWFKPFALTIACAVLGVAVRVVLARPHAVGLLARPARGGGAEGPGHARHRPLQPVVRPPGAPVPRRHRVGARPPQDDGRPGRRHLRRRHRPPGHGRRLRLHPGERPQRADGHRRGPAGLQPRVHAHADRADRPPAAHARRGPLHLRHRRQRVGLGRGRRGDHLRPPAPQGRARREPVGVRPPHPRRAAPVRVGHGLPPRGRRPGRRQKPLQLQLQGPDARTLARLADLDRCGRARHAGRGRRSACQQGAEARSSG
jgi:hypothetical protein